MPSRTREQRDGSAAYDITYTLDPVGNRATMLAGGTTTTYTYNAGDALTVANAGGVLNTFSFDDAGNNTVVNADGAATTYTWDGENRLSVIALPTAEVLTLTYDAAGLRRRRQDSGGTTAFTCDGQNAGGGQGPKPLRAPRRQAHGTVRLHIRGRSLRGTGPCDSWLCSAL